MSNLDSVVYQEVNECQQTTTAKKRLLKITGMDFKIVARVSTIAKGEHAIVCDAIIEVPSCGDGDIVNALTKAKLPHISLNVKQKDTLYLIVTDITSETSLRKMLDYINADDLNIYSNDEIEDINYRILHSMDMLGGVSVPIGPAPTNLEKYFESSQDGPFQHLKKKETPEALLYFARSEHKHNGFEELHDKEQVLFEEAKESLRRNFTLF